MITFKCKMCGGDLHPEDNATTCECEYCGSVQTIPTADNEKKGNLFNRANRLRMAAEYDKAAAVYTSITAEFPEEAEAYWGLCLCKYGIEYVEDPVTAKKIPTCHRTRSDSIMDDPDFDQACENADAIAKKVYREEAKAIDRLQRDILSVVANESPYDVFICYKETDDNGERTEDSVLAQDIYDALTAKGLKVFFARITLEDKLGKQYEPYIYAALHSAKVMLSIGTQYEYFDAVWVKNEWARFLDMMKSDKSKTLIPCFKDIDAYDMPREFKNLQAQDMGKLGWLQDLTRGVMKLCGKDEVQKQQAVIVQQPVQSANPTTDSLLKRAFVFLEDGEWDSAIEYADKVLDINVENGQAYLVKLMADLKARNQEEFTAVREDFSENQQYKKIVRFGDEELKRQVQECLATVLEKERIEAERIASALERIEYNGKCFARRETVVLELEEARRDLDELKRGIDDDSVKLNNLHGLFSGMRRKDLEERLGKTRNQYQLLKEKEALLQKEYVAIKSNSDCVTEEELHYSNMTLYMVAKWYAKAYDEYLIIPGYKDSDERIKEAIEQDPEVSKRHREYMSFSKSLTEIGQTVYFGRYLRKGQNRHIPLEWIVLEKRNDDILLISKCAVEKMPFQNNTGIVTWNSSDIKEWLNNSFYKTTFNIQEKGLMVDLDSESNEKAKSSQKRDSFGETKVSLLTAREAKRLFSSDTARRTSMLYDVSRDQNCAWWLRSRGAMSDFVSYVDNGGTVIEGGCSAIDGENAVRPVILVHSPVKV
ncbi:MAG: TIR domain-containing protein [Parasporobacterium sp.]|nr:TIR domain-containing protein [Parasporobacterium sp.]